MSLYIEVYVGHGRDRHMIADATAHNISDLRDTSDYDFSAIETGNFKLGIPPNDVDGKIMGHYRKQSVWALVEKVAQLSKGNNNAA